MGKWSSETRAREPAAIARCTAYSGASERHGRQKAKVHRHARRSSGGGAEYRDSCRLWGGQLSCVVPPIGSRQRCMREAGITASMRTLPIISGLGAE